MSKRKAWVALAAVLVAASIKAGWPARKAPTARVFSHSSGLVLVDDVYPSMMGPTDNRYDLKLFNGAPEIVWLTGYSAKMVDANGARQSQELMCHDTLSIHDLALHQRLFDPVQARQNRIFTLSQGQASLDFPEGFGIPMSANENLMLQSQVLNLREEGIGSTVSHRIETRYVADKDLDQPMKALALIDGGIAVDVDDPQARRPAHDMLSCGTDAGGQPTYNVNGRELTAHWVVKPGFERRETSMGKMFPIDTTAHYISVHMHSYGKSLELYDVTAGKSVYKSLCSASSDGMGLASTTCYSSQQGLPVYKDHEYKVISEYENTSKENQTAMAFVFVYIYNPGFQKPGRERIVLISSDPSVELCEDDKK